jgi:hypothetical protein
MIVLTSASNSIQIITGIFAQVLLLPEISTLVPGRTFTIYNDGANSVVVKDSNGFDIHTQSSLTKVEYKVPGSGSTWIVSSETPIALGTIPAASQGFIQAPNVMRLSGPNHIFLCSQSMGPLVKLFLPGDLVNGQALGATGPEICKIPVDVNSGNMIYWHDPDPAKWFDMDGLQSFPKIDFYLTGGSGNESIPLNFNGQGFSIKMGVLLADANVSSFVGGGVGNNRVTTKTWQPGTIF